MRPSFAYFAVAAVGLLVLLAPALINGAPIYWHDSLAHLHGGSSALHATTGLETRYSVMERAILPEPGSPAPGAGTVAGTGATAAAEDYRISMARSPYYSVVIVGLSAVGGPLAPLVMQALMVLASGIFLVRAVFAEARLGPALWLLAILPFTTAGIFSAILLPDVLAPLGILATAVLFGFYERLARIDKLFWFVLLVFSVISHTSHLAVAMLLIPLGLVLALLTRRPRVLAPAAVCTAAVLAGMLSLSLFSQTVKAIYGYEPRPFPMIAASLIVDGPGLAYLRATCPDNGYVYCRNLDITAQTIDQYLWFEDETVGVYRHADPETRRLMSDQQGRFLVDTLRFDFPGQVAASFRRFMAQLGENTLDHMLYTAQLRQELSTALPDPDRGLAQASAAYRDALPLSLAGQVGQLVALASLVALIALMLAARGPADRTAADRGALVVLTVLVLAGIVANAGITGVASNPQGRYGARVLWLLPVVLAVWAAWIPRRSGR